MFVRTSRPFPPLFLLSPPSTGPMMAPSKYTEKFVTKVLSRQMLKSLIELESARTLMLAKLMVTVTSVAPPQLHPRSTPLVGHFTTVQVTKPVNMFSAFT